MDYLKFKISVFAIDSVFRRSVEPDASSIVFHTCGSAWLSQFHLTKASFDKRVVTIIVVLLDRVFVSEFRDKDGRLCSASDDVDWRLLEACNTNTIPE